MIELFVSHGSVHDRAVCLSRFCSLSSCSPLTVLLMIGLFTAHGSVHDQAVCLSRFRSLSGCSPLTVLFMIELFVSHDSVHDRAVCLSWFCSWPGCSPLTVFLMIGLFVVHVSAPFNTTRLPRFLTIVTSPRCQVLLSELTIIISSLNVSSLFHRFPPMPPMPRKCRTSEKLRYLGGILIVLTYTMRFFFSYGSDDWGTVL